MIINTLRIAILLTSLLIISCDRPDCVNTNPVFDENSPDSKLYKDELINELKLADQAKLTYWLKNYEKKNGQEYLNFHVQGDGICAIIEMSVNDWSSLEDLREKKGVSYRGAEFRGLSYEISSTENETRFIYKSHANIID